MLPFFWTFIDRRHQNRFTIGPENNSTLSFLDILIEKIHGGLTFSIYRKPTFSGLSISIFSHCSFRYKINAIHRAYNLSSNLSFH